MKKSGVEKNTAGKKAFPLAHKVAVYSYHSDNNKE